MYVNICVYVGLIHFILRAFLRFFILFFEFLLRTFFRYWVIHNFLLILKSRMLKGVLESHRLCLLAFTMKCSAWARNSVAFFLPGPIHQRGRVQYSASILQANWQKTVQEPQELVCKYQAPVFVQHSYTQLSSFSYPRDSAVYLPKGTSLQRPAEGQEGWLIG